MIGDLKQTFWKSAVYALGNVATKLIGLILIPLYTNVEYFSVSDYGAMGILEITSQVLVAILGLSLAQSLTRWYWDSDFVEKQRSVFFTSLFLMVGLSIFFIVLLYPFSGFFSQTLFQNNDSSYIIKLVLISSGLQVISNHILALAKLQGKALLYSLNNIIKLSITLGLTIYFIVGCHKKLDGIFEAQVIGAAFSLIILLPYSLKNSELKFEWLILKDMLIFGYPLIIASISGVFFSVIDRYFLNFMRGLDDVGIYNLGYKLSSTLNVVVITSVQLALSPLMMKKMNDPENKRFYSKVMTYFSFVLMFAIIALSLFSLEGIKLFVNNTIYWNSVNIVAILSFATLFGMMKDQALIGLHITKKTKITGTVIVIATAINIILNAIFIPWWGIYGAAIGTLISQIAFFGIIYYKAQRAYYIPFEIAKIFKIIIVGGILLAIGLLLNPVNPWVRIPVKLFLLAFYFIILYYLNFFDASEKEAIHRIYHTWKNPGSISENIKRLMGG